MDRAPKVPVVAKVEKSAVPFSKAENKLHQMALAHMKNSKDRLSYESAYNIAGKQRPDLLAHAINGTEPDSDDSAAA